LPLAEGANAFSFWAISSYGDSSAMGSASVNVDTQAPAERTAGIPQRSLSRPLPRIPRRGRASPASRSPPMEEPGLLLAAHSLSLMERTRFRCRPRIRQVGQPARARPSKWIHRCRN
jgi:hypothetical protein